MKTAHKGNKNDMEDREMRKCFLFDAFKLERIANKFCRENSEEYPDIWWCFGTCVEYRVLFYTAKWSESENAKPVWKMDNEGNISAIS